MELQVRLDYPMMAVGASAFEQKGVRPRSPILLSIQMALRAANRPINQGSAAGEADAACARVAFEELAIRQTVEGDDFTCDCVPLHEYSCAAPARRAFVNTGPASRSLSRQHCGVYARLI